jgi:DNA-binding GntR family transcriptional regulator
MSGLLGNICIHKSTKIAICTDLYALKPLFVYNVTIMEENSVIEGPTTAAEQVYAALSEEILEGDLVSGTSLTELDLAARFSVSRTPVREALTRLSAEGLLVPLGSRGLMVRPLTGNELTSVYELRVALELQAVRLAANRADSKVFSELKQQLESASDLVFGNKADLRSFYDLHERFDSAIQEAIDSPFLSAALASLQLHLKRIRRITRHNPQRLIQAAHETAIVAGAIARGDSDVAEAAMRVHLSESLSASLHSLDHQIANQPRDRKNEK